MRVTEETIVDATNLDNEAGCTAAALVMGKAVCRDVLYPVLDLTPKEWRQVVLERFLSAITGVLCAEVGPERARQSLDAVKLAIDEVVAHRAARH